MFRKNEHAQILNAAVQAIRLSMASTTGLSVAVTTEPEAGPGDARVTFTLERDRLIFDAEVKLSPGPAAATVVAARSPQPDRALLVADRLTPAVLEACRELELNCADTDGNMLIRWPGSVINIEGRPATTSKTSRPQSSGSLVTGKAGLQLIFVLLAFPHLIDTTVRRLAHAAGIATGSVSNVLTELQETNQLRQLRGRRELTNPAGLVDTFVDGYRRRLYDRLVIGDFLSSDPTWWQEARNAVADAGGQWGGESALWLRRRLKPARGVVYLDSLDRRLLIDMRMRHDPGGATNAQFRRRFWHVDGGSQSDTVPRILVYADLIADGDPRLLEAAADMRQAVVARADR